jgi:hypothetical protein
MATSLANLMINEGPAIYYDPAFRNVLEDHMNYLRKHPSTEVVQVEDGQAFFYTNDFYGLTRALLIPPELQWVMLRMNNMKSPIDYKEDRTLLLRPNQTVVDFIRQSYTSTNRTN